MEPVQPHNDQPQTNTYEPQPPVAMAPAPQSQPAPTPPPAPTPMPTKESTGKDLKTIILVAIIALLAISVGVLGYLLMNQKDTTSSNDDKNVSVANKKEETKEAEKEAEEKPAIKDEYEGWKTFPKDSQSLFSEGGKITPAPSAITWENMIEFRFPANWKARPAIGDVICGNLMGHIVSGDFNAGTAVTKGGSMCISNTYYTGQNSTVDAKANSLIANGEWVYEKEMTVGGKRTVAINRVKSLPENSGGKHLFMFVDNLVADTHSKTGTIIACMPQGSAADREAFLKECDLVTESIKFTNS